MDLRTVKAESLMASLRAVVAELSPREDFDYCMVSDSTGIPREYLQLVYPTLHDLRSIEPAGVPIGQSGTGSRRVEPSSDASGERT